MFSFFVFSFFIQLFRRKTPNGTWTLRYDIFYVSLLNFAPCGPSRLRVLPITNTRLRTCAPYPSLIHALRACAPLISPITALQVIFIWSCSFNCKVRLKTEIPRKATGTDFIPLKVNKFASNVINSGLYNIIVKDLEKTNTQKCQKHISKTDFQGK